ncbi:MAG TPA: glutathione-disulfide reductase, partial [Caulobacteraceae bacterium]|nr:glutathione-disulfide reductase [Caulobacteraceae bacterium]
CIPKKFMVYASEVAHQVEVAKGYGWSGFDDIRFDWKTFLEKKDVEIARLSGIYVRNLSNAGAELVHGRAELRDAHTVELVGKDRKITADKILIAVGGWPSVPEFEGSEHAITSNEAFQLHHLPKSVMVVGGGYIAVEFASIFNGLGVETTLVYRGPNILRGFDDDVRTHLGGELEKRGIKLILASQHEKIEKTSEGLVSHLAGDMKQTTDVVMFATGRAPKISGLGLEKAGVAVNDEGAIAVDAYSKTSVDNIYAVGDVTDRINLTPVAIREGAAFAETVFRGNPTTYDHACVPIAVFSQPPVGSVGLTEADARHQHGQIDVYKSTFRPLKQTFFGGEDRTMMKLVVEAKTQKILGCHIVGDDAPEMIQMAAIAIKMGITKQQWDNTTALHPTAAEELVTMREKFVPPDLGAG